VVRRSIHMVKPIVGGLGLRWLNLSGFYLKRRNNSRIFFWIYLASRQSLKSWRVVRVQQEKEP